MIPTTANSEHLLHLSAARYRAADRIKTSELALAIDDLLAESHSGGEPNLARTASALGVSRNLVYRHMGERLEKHRQGSPLVVTVEQFLEGYPERDGKLHRQRAYIPLEPLEAGSPLPSTITVADPRGYPSEEGE